MTNCTQRLAVQTSLSIALVCALLSAGRAQSTVSCASDGFSDAHQISKGDSSRQDTPSSEQNKQSGPPSSSAAKSELSNLELIQLGLYSEVIAAAQKKQIHDMSEIELVSTAVAALATYQYHLSLNYLRQAKTVVSRDPKAHPGRKGAIDILLDLGRAYSGVPVLPQEKSSLSTEALIEFSKQIREQFVDSVYLLGLKRVLLVHGQLETLALLHSRVNLSKIDPNFSEPNKLVALTQFVLFASTKRSTARSTMGLLDPESGLYRKLPPEIQREADFFSYRHSLDNIVDKNEPLNLDRFLNPDRTLKTSLSPEESKDLFNTLKENKVWAEIEKAIARPNGFGPDQLAWTLVYLNHRTDRALGYLLIDLLVHSAGSKSITHRNRLGPSTLLAVARFYLGNSDSPDVTDQDVKIARSYMQNVFSILGEDSLRVDRVVETNQLIHFVQGQLELGLQRGFHFIRTAGERVPKNKTFMQTIDVMIQLGRLDEVLKFFETEQRHRLSIDPKLWVKRHLEVLQAKYEAQPKILYQKTIEAFGGMHIDSRSDGGLRAPLAQAYLLTGNVDQFHKLYQDPIKLVGIASRNRDGSSTQFSHIRHAISEATAMATVLEISGKSNSALRLLRNLEERLIDTFGIEWLTQQQPVKDAIGGDLNNLRNRILLLAVEAELSSN